MSIRCTMPGTHHAVDPGKIYPCSDASDHLPEFRYNALAAGCTTMPLGLFTRMHISVLIKDVQMHVLWP